MKGRKRFGFFCAAILIALCMLVSIVFTSVEFVAYDDAFYLKQYEKNNAETLTGLSSEQLMQITDEMQKFLRGERIDFNITVTIDGEDQAVFTEREQQHMLDVQNLFLRFGTIRWIAVGVLGAIFLILLVWGEKSAFRLFLSATIGSVLVLVFVSVFGALLFEPLFLFFHRIFFSNTLWVLDPAKSVLINMVPQEFFVACAVRIALYSLIFYAACLVAFAFGFKIMNGRKS